MAFLRHNRLSTKLFHNKLTSFQVKRLRMCGFIIDENQKFELWHFWRSAFLTLSLVITCVLQFGKLIIKGSGSAISTSTACFFLTTSIAITNMFFRRKRLARMLAFLQEDVDKLLIKTDEREEMLFDEIYRYMSIIRNCIWVPIFVAGTTVSTDVFYRFAFNPDFFFNLEDVRNGTDTQALLSKLFPFREIHDDLFLVYIFPMYAMIVAMESVPMLHTLITSLMSYVNLKWKIMHKRLSEMDISKVILSENESAQYLSLVSEADKTNYLRTKLCAFCAIEQIRIRWFVQDLQDLIYIPVFADFIISSIVICFLFYEMCTGNSTKMDFLFMSTYVFILFFILWLHYWHATLVKENNELMGFAIYSCDWYNYPVKLQKMIQLIMTMSGYPLDMKAVIVPLNMTSFIDIIRAGFSYFSILRNST